MELKQLYTFLMASETLNFTKTAQMLNYAQSSVTAQIKALEREFETPLFDRLGKRLILTEGGHKFRSYAQSIVNLSEEAKKTISNSQETMTIKIGAQESQCTYRLPHLLKEFKQKYPLVRLVFKPAHSDKKAAQDLKEGTLDVAFITDREEEHHNIQTETLLEEKLLLVTSPEHHLSKASIIETSDLQNETLLLTESGCSYRTLFEKELLLYGVSLTNAIEFLSIEAIKKCAAANLGIALLPEMTVRREIENGDLQSLSWNASLPPLITKMAFHENKWLSPILHDFRNMTIDYFQRKENFC
jgi:DNA-binding transcriptional LysR family regulator